jgi:hypothetical protein
MVRYFVQGDCQSACTLPRLYVFEVLHGRTVSTAATSPIISFTEP